MTYYMSKWECNRGNKKNNNYEVQRKRVPSNYKKKKQWACFNCFALAMHHLRVYGHVGCSKRFGYLTFVDFFPSSLKLLPTSSGMDFTIPVGVKLHGNFCPTGTSIRDRFESIYMYNLFVMNFMNEVLSLKGIVGL